MRSNTEPLAQYRVPLFWSILSFSVERRRGVPTDIPIAGSYRIRRRRDLAVNEAVFSIDRLGARHYTEPVERSLQASRPFSPRSHVRECMARGDLAMAR